jgi:hypothetical protein
MLSSFNYRIAYVGQQGTHPSSRAIGHTFNGTGDLVTFYEDIILTLNFSALLIFFTSASG